MSVVGKKAKILSKSQVENVKAYLDARRGADRNVCMFLLSVRAGLRAKEIAGLRWSDVLDSDGQIGEILVLRNVVSKGGYGGREIPLSKDLRKSLEKYWKVNSANEDNNVFRGRSGDGMSAQVIVNWFRKLYGRLGLVGCSSHSGRRTAITAWARKIGSVGGSLNDVRYLAGHSSLQMTQSYIDFDSESRRRVVNLI